ncbi:MAG: right-handed parallel beta-helix repeat-containing protein [Candidatus Nanopelagicales bacterium]
MTALRTAFAATPASRLVSAAAAGALALGVLGAVVPTADASPVTMLDDSFTRTVASGWGSAEIGGVWTPRGGTAAQYNVDGQSGTMTMKPGEGPNVDANGVTVRDQDVVATITADKIAVGGGNYVAVIARRQPTKELYAAQLNLGTTRPVLTMFRRSSAEVQTNVGASATSASTFTAGAPWRIRFSVTGTNPTTLAAKAWPAASPEPAAWMTTTTDSTAALQTAGAPGVGAYLSGKATNAPIVVSVGSFSVTTTVLPSAPAGLRATTGATSVALSWDAVPGADGYRVYRDGALVASPTGTSATDGGLTPGTDYAYSVAAVNEVGTGARSATLHATPPVPVPAAPSDLAATAGDGRVDLAWSAVPGATSYDVVRDGDTVATVTEPAYADKAATNGTRYSYAVTAANTSGSSDPSSPVAATPLPPKPAVPAGLVAVAGDQRVALTWTAVPGADGYRVYRDGTLVASPTSASYADTDVVNGTSYSWTVSAQNIAGASAQSAAVAATPMPPLPSVPSGVSAAAGDGAVVVSWSAVAHADDYVVSRDGVVVATGTGTSWTDTGLVNGTTYGYTVVARNISGSSAASGSVSARPLPPVPAAPGAPTLVAGDGRVTLTWASVAQATSYAVYRDGIAIASGVAALTFTDSGLVNGTSYSYTVAAANLAGASARSTAASATPMPPLPAVPSGLAAVAGDGQVSLSWTASSSATGFRVYRAGTLVASPTSTSYVDAGLSNGTAYAYTVAAVNMSGSSAQSSAVSATPVKPGRASASAGAAALGSTSYAVPAGAVFVATNGSDANAGSQAAPVATVSRAVALVASGGTVVLRGGTYHQGDLKITKSVTIQSFPGEVVWFDGARVVSGWVADGAAWRVDGWTAAFDHSPTYTAGAPDSTTPGFSFVNAAYPMAAYPDMVWIDGAPLTQVASVAAVTAGKFFVDTVNQRLYVGSNPTGRKVEAADTSFALYMIGANTVLRGFGVRRYATSLPLMGTVRVVGAGSVVENVVLADNATQGLYARANNLTLRHVTATGMGLLGVQANYADGLRVEGLRTTGNNVERFNRAPVSGGLKVTRSRGITVVDSVISNNLGQGLWFDESVYDITITGNEANANTGSGIVTELSEKVVIADNIANDNTIYGLYIINTGGVAIWNNTLSRNDRNIFLKQDARSQFDTTAVGHDPRQPLPDPTVPWLISNVTIRNNILDNAKGNAVLAVEDQTKTRTAEQMAITSDDNVYLRASSTAPSWEVVWSAGSGNGGNPYVYTTLAAFRTAKGQEARSVSSDNGSACGTPVPAGLTTQVAGLLGRPVGDLHMGAY